MDGKYIFFLFYFLTTKEKNSKIMHSTYYILLLKICGVVSYQVVMAVAQLYFHLAPKAEVGVIAKALVRLLRSHR